jgi:hypothetical protein
VETNAVMKCLICHSEGLGVILDIGICGGKLGFCDRSVLGSEQAELVANRHQGVNGIESHVARGT